jgi:UPF0271 protein
MPDTGTVTVVDLNADIAEGAELTDDDLGILDSVTSASLACGFHAGSRTVMRAAAAACMDRGIVIGAHVSFRDRDGFGRRPLRVGRRQLIDDIIEQCAVLIDEVTAAGGAVDFVKPHGALYNMMGSEPGVAAAVVAALVRHGAGVLIAQSGSAVVEPARASGLRVVFEGFPDRGYLADGRLSGRGEPGALIEDPAAAGRRAVSLVRRHGVEAVDGTWASVEVETLCIHGDSPGAVAMARTVRSSLEAEGITVDPFIDAAPVRDPGPTDRPPR